MQSIFYVYQYIDNAGNIYYIGKGCGARYRESHSYVDVPPNDRIEFVKTDMQEDDAYDLEELLTRQYGLRSDGTGILENKVHGGKSTHIPSFTGHTHTDEAKQKISDKNTGKVRTAEHRLNYSKPKTAEHAERIRQANLGRPSCKARNRAISESMKTKRWFRNDTNSIFCNPGNEPTDYYPGRITNKRKA